MSVCYWFVGDGAIDRAYCTDQQPPWPVSTLQRRRWSCTWWISTAQGGTDSAVRTVSHDNSQKTELSLSVPSHRIASQLRTQSKSLRHYWCQCRTRTACKRSSRMLSHVGCHSGDATRREVTATTTTSPTGLDTLHIARRPCTAANTPAAAAAAAAMSIQYERRRRTVISKAPLSIDRWLLRRLRFRCLLRLHFIWISEILTRSRFASQLLSALKSSTSSHFEC